MKKKCAWILGILVGTACLFSGCGFSGGKADGRTPYDVAVEEGYSGSEDAWLADETPASTLYRRMWQEAVSDGYGGTYFEFLKELGLGGGGAELQRSLLSAVSIVSAYPGGSASAGSGVILSLEDGDLDVVTNYHLIYNSTLRRVSEDVSVYLYGGEVSLGRLSAHVVGGSPSEDLALLHVDGEEEVTSGGSTYRNGDVVRNSAACAATFGSSESLLAGESVYAIGNPEAWGLSVVQGVVSMPAEYVTMSSLTGDGDVDMLEIRTDAAVNHGNSGGGLFNGAGELVGIVNARSEASGVEGVGYAIPVDHALAVIGNIKENGGVYKRARLGITLETRNSHSVYDPASGRTFVSETLVVNAVTTGSAAESGGLDVGDTLISLTLHGKTVQATQQYKVGDLLIGVRQGDTLQMTVSRGGETVSLSIVYDRDGYFETGK